jgi:non-specific serine/threonine protein kinase
MLLQRHRLAAGLSQAELAERAGLSQRGISDLERGLRQAAYPATLRRLAEALGLSEAERAALLAATRRPGPTQAGADTAEPTPTAPPATARPAHNLPRQLTSLIGRDRELAELRRLVMASHLLTLTGPGGVGKTRLALRLAEVVLPDWADGVWLVELAALADPRLVPEAVAATLGIREQPGRALVQTLAERLGPKHLLLVLDSCEHLVDACAALADHLLRACPELRLLATSREPLRIPGETTWRVDPLALPPARAAVEQVADTAAVRLFVERARAVMPTFGLTERTAGPVAALCRGLDGLPLALELAAARAPGLGVELLARRLDDRLRLLATGSRMAPARQQTLRATLAWSYDLLDPAEQRVFRGLAVFAGGWSPEAAETVLGGDVLEVFGTLVDKSLVQRGGTEAAPRFAFLETVRVFALEQLAAAADSTAVQDRHAAYFLALAETADRQLRGLDQAIWFERLEREHDNLRAALHWALERQAMAAASGLLGALWWFWLVRGHLTEGRRWLEAFLATPAGTAPTAARAAALDYAGYLTCWQGDVPQARAWAEQALVIWRDLGDRRGMAYARRAPGRPRCRADPPGQGRRSPAQTADVPRRADHRRIPGSVPAAARDAARPRAGGHGYPHRAAAARQRADRPRRLVWPAHSPPRGTRCGADRRRRRSPRSTRHPARSAASPRHWPRPG